MSQLQVFLLVWPSSETIPSKNETDKYQQLINSSSKKMKKIFASDVFFCLPEENAERVKLVILVA